MTDNGTASNRNSSTGLRSRDPLDLTQELNEDLFRFLDLPFDFPLLGTVRRFSGLGRVSPRIDMFEKDQNLVVTAELPGVKKEDLQVELQDHDLVIRGERHEEHEDKAGGENQYYRMERRRGMFFRRVRLPFDTDVQNVHASFSDGVLEVRIPEPSEPKSGAKQIRVS